MVVKTNGEQHWDLRKQFQNARSQPSVQAAPNVLQTRAGPLLIQKGKDHVIESFDIKETKILDATRLISELSGLNVVPTSEAGEKTVTLYLRNVTARDIIETLSKVAGLWYREDSKTGTIRIMTSEQYQKDLIVHREDLTKVFTLRHPNAMSIATAIESLYGDRTIVSFGRTEDDYLQQTSGIGNGLGTGTFARSGMFSGSSRFSRPASRNQIYGSGAFGRGGYNQRGQDSDLARQLTAEQISILEQRQGEVGQEGLPQAVAAQTLQAITQREPPIYVIVNRPHNLVIVRTSHSEAMKSIEKLVLEIDRPTSEVLLEMRILEITLDDNFRSVFDVQFNAGPTGPTAAEQELRNPFIQSAAIAAQSVLGLGNFSASNGTIVYQFLNDNIRARIELLESQSRVKRIATPLLLASNNRPATIFVGEFTQTRPLLNLFVLDTIPRTAASPIANRLFLHAIKDVSRVRSKIAACKRLPTCVRVVFAGDFKWMQLLP